MLVASLTVSGYTPGSMWLQLSRSGDASPAHSIPVNIESFGLDWNPGGDDAGRRFRGRLASVELPPGSYEFGRWVMMVANTAAYTSGARVGPRFTIKAGEVVYVGNLHFDIQKSASSSLPFRVDVNDERKRDLALLSSRYPGIRIESVRVHLGGGEDAAPAAPARGVRIEELEGLLRGR
jgi:hypothetical protein